MYKFLKSIFIVLLILTLIEITVYVYIEYVKPINLSDNSFVKSGVSPAVLNVNDSSPQEGEVNEDYALDIQTLETVKKIKKGVLLSSTLTNRLSGKITKIETDSEISGFQFKLNLVIEGEYDHIRGMAYSSHDMDRIKLFELKENIETPASLDDFNVGDDVIIEEVFDLTKGYDDNMVEGKITKI